MGTILAGVVFSKFLLMSGLQNMLVRFIVVLILAYLTFFLLMRLWLNYLTKPYRRKLHEEDVLNAADIAVNIPDFSSSGSSQAFQGHGGASGGAGASGSWEGAGASANLSVSDSALEATESVSGIGGETAGEALVGLADEGAILLIPLGLLLAALFGGGIYLIYEAPVIISEAAFQFVLASSLIKRARKMDNPDWVGSVFRATWPALLVTLVITAIASWSLMAYCPQATKIRDVFQYCL
jgi:hypothetical protein